MEFILLLVAVGIFAETTYLTLHAVRPNAKVDRGSIVLDTSVLIDGRITSIARSGLIGTPLIVPTSVVRELQFMADKADHEKRERARFGLDTIERLQTLNGVELSVIDDGITDQHGVDEQLIRLSQKWHAKLCTIDYNLNKSARVQGVEVVNINELAHALRVTYLPGETLEVKLIQQGQDQHQGVGYLDDGTMVVVDNAKAFVGQCMKVEATRVLQTAAGKMLFARMTPENQPPKQKQPNQRKSMPDSSDKPKRRNNQNRRGNKQRTPDHEDKLIALANDTK